jgi:hypothetical protein
MTTTHSWDSLKNRIRGWLPQTPRLAYASDAAKPRWRKPQWIALTAVAVVAVAFAASFGVQTYIRYSNPQADVTASYFEKSLNCSKANAGDVVEVTTRVGWHGYIFPEFKRQVTFIDPYPESNFQLVGGNNTYSYVGGGGSDQFTYQLKVISDVGAVDLPEPKLYLDNVEIPLTGISTVTNSNTTLVEG